MKNTLINAAVSAIIAGLIVLFFGGSGFSFGAESRAPNTQASFDTVTAAGDLSTGDEIVTHSDVTASTTYSSNLTGSVAAGSNIGYWYNNTGATVYVDEGIYATSGTASTTYQVSMFATTTSPTTIASTFAYTALTEAINGANSFLSLNHTIATSTVATTTNSQMEMKSNRGNGIISVASSGYLIVFLQNVASGGGGPGCSGSVCETATSTNRGFNITWKIRYIR